MTVKTMPDWAKPGTEVLITGRDTGPVVRAQVSRVTEHSVFVSSTAWREGYERRFVPVRTQWKNASASALEEFGRGTNGFGSAARCVPADGDEGKSLLRKAAIRDAQGLATAAAQRFADRPTKANAEAARQRIAEWAQVAP